MGRQVTVSAKISEELRERMRELKIRPSKVIREAVEREVRRGEVERLKQVLEEADPLLSRLSVDRAVRSIREDRNHR